MSSKDIDWEGRYQRLAASRPTSDPTIHSIPVTELAVGDNVRWCGDTYTVTRCEPNGSLIEVDAYNDTREIENHYLDIERVDITKPTVDTTVDPPTKGPVE